MTEAEMCSWCADRVPYFVVPRYIEFRDELPRNPVGCVLKYQLRDEGRTPATWDLEDAGFELAKRGASPGGRKGTGLEGKGSVARGREQDRDSRTRLSRSSAPCQGG